MEPYVCQACKAQFSPDAAGEALRHPKNGCAHEIELIYLKCPACGLPVDDCDCDMDEVYY